MHRRQGEATGMDGQGQIIKGAVGHSKELQFISIRSY